jgi:hypothetical protein
MRGREFVRQVSYPDRDGSRFMPARSFSGRHTRRPGHNQKPVILRSVSCAVDREGEIETGRTGHFRSNNRDRRFESTSLPRAGVDVLDFPETRTKIPACAGLRAILPAPENKYFLDSGLPDRPRRAQVATPLERARYLPPTWPVEQSAGYACAQSVVNASTVRFSRNGSAPPCDMRSRFRRSIRTPTMVEKIYRHLGWVTG